MSVAIQKIDGVESVSVSLTAGLADIGLEPGNSIDPEQIREIVRDNGFTPKSAEVEVIGRIGEQAGRPVFSVTGADIVYLLVLHPDATNELDELRTTSTELDVIVMGRLPETEENPDPGETRRLQLRDFSRSPPE